MTTITQLKRREAENTDKDMDQLDVTTDVIDPDRETLINALLDCDVAVTEAEINALLEAYRSNADYRVNEAYLNNPHSMQGIEDGVAYVWEDDPAWMDVWITREFDGDGLTVMDVSAAVREALNATQEWVPRDARDTTARARVEVA